MTGSWRAFEDELARWHAGGREVEFWWRDDDAGRPTPLLARLLGLAAASGVPLALAVVPAEAVAELFAGLPPDVEVLQHGVDHGNRAAPQAKKAEFTSAEPVGSALRRLAAGQARLAALNTRAGRTAVLAPPWNRLPRELIPHLPEIGIRGLSTYGARAQAQPAPGLTQVNAHVDLIAWRGNRAFVGEESALQQAVAHLAAKRLGQADPSEATGWLTHHACHDEAAWTFLERLFEVTRRAQGVQWRCAAALFGQAGVQQ